jgi:hypothetical protein
VTGPAVGPEMGEDGYLLMDRYSDADIDDAELGDEGWFAAPEPLSEATWLRVLAGAVSDAVDHPDVAAAFDDPEWVAAEWESTDLGPVDHGAGWDDGPHHPGPGELGEHDPATGDGAGPPED